MKLVKRHTTSIVAFVSILIIIGFAYLLSYDSSLAKIRKDGTIRIGYAIEAPYSYLTEKGEVTGESPEIAQYVAKKMGIKNIQWKLMEFGSLIPELEAGKIDVIAAGLFITNARARQVSFSIPTFHVRQSLLVYKGNPRNITSFAEAIRSTDIKIAVISGAIEEKLLRDAGFIDERLVVVPDAMTGRTAVESHVADALALSSPTIKWMAFQEQSDNTEVVDDQDAASYKNGWMGYGAFAFRKSDRKLKQAWDAVLKDFINSDNHLKMVSPFGFTRAEMPGRIRIEEILYRETKN